MNVELECYILSDQPTTCGLCGARTTFEVKDDDVQVHQCLNQGCKYIFITLSD
jgi:hypothetical protein